MTRLASLHARITGDASGFVSAAQQAENAAQDASAAMGAAQARGGRAGLGAAAAGLRGSFQRLASSPGMRMLPIQLSQVAQQAAAGGGVMRALSIQAADIGLAFGAVGAIVGTLATVAMPLVIGAFSDGKDASDDLRDSISTLTDAQARLEGTLDILSMSVDELVEKYGAAAAEVREFAIELAHLQYQQAISETREYQLAIADLGDEFLNITRGRENTAAFRRLRRELDLSTDQALELREAIVSLRSAEGIDAQIAASRELTRVMQEVGVSAEDIDDSMLDVQAALLEAGIAGAELERVLAAVRDRAAEAANAAEGIPGMTYGIGAGLTGLSGQELLPPPPADGPDDEGGSSGSARGANPLDRLGRDLENIQNRLRDELEIEQELHEERREILQQALENELLTHEEYNDLIERERERHHEAMSNLDVYRYGTGAQQLEAFMGEMASAFASGNERMLQISKVFGAGEALINAWRTFSQVMSDPSLPWFAKLPAAISLLGSAMQAVQAIQGVGKGGTGRKSVGGGSGAGGADGGQAADPRGSRPAVSLTLIGENGFTRAQIVQIAEALNQSGDDGQQLVQVNRGRR